MADSDDEYDKKIRDKFRGERDRGDSYKGIDNRREERRPQRDDWIERLYFYFLLLSVLRLREINAHFVTGMRGIQDLEDEVISEISWENDIARWGTTQDHLWNECGTTG